MSVICGDGMCPYVPCKDYPKCNHIKGRRRKMNNQEISRLKGDLLMIVEPTKRGQFRFLIKELEKEVREDERNKAKVKTYCPVCNGEDEASVCKWCYSDLKAKLRKRK